MKDVLRGDLVVTNDSYYGIVLDVKVDSILVFCSNGLTVSYVPGYVTNLPLQQGSRFSNMSNANFAEILHRG